MTRPTFSSSLTTVLTMTGVAVGLGNVWRFPYMMGKFGGSAFFFLFLFFVVCFAIPAVMGEWALGRATRQGPVGAFTKTLGPRCGKVIGLGLSIGLLIANSYYLLVIGYIAYTAHFGLRHRFDGLQIAAFESGLNTGWLQFGIALCLLMLVLWTLWFGLNRGIERVSVFFLPLFGIIIMVLIAYSLALPGAVNRLLQFLEPNFQTMAKPSNIFAAMGQAFFSLSLGGTFFVSYGSYLRQDERIPKPAILTGLGDAAAALMAALFIVPAVLVFGIELDQGPGLIFQTLPRLFETMPGGWLLGSCFLLGLLLVAFLSSVAALQVITGTLIEDWGMGRAKVLILVGIIEMALILPSAHRPELIGKLDLIFGSAMQCLGSAIALFALTYGLGRTRALKEIFGANPPKHAGVFFFWLRWVIPSSLLFILLLSIIEKLA